MYTYVCGFDEKQLEKDSGRLFLHSYKYTYQDISFDGAYESISIVLVLNTLIVETSMESVNQGISEWSYAFICIT